MKIVVPIFGLLLWLPGVLMAESGIHFMMDEAGDTSLRLEMRQTSLADTLNEIAGKTGLLVHSSALPLGLFSVTCMEATLTEILQCLLDKKADFIFRYSQSKPVEVWVLGADFSQDNVVSKARARVPERVVEKVLGNGQNAADNDSDEEIAKLLEKATDNNPALRMDAIAGLADKGIANDLAVHKALTEALSDPDVQVREQAVSSLARREGDRAAAELQSALRDSDASVRLMVVDSAGENAALLQHALSDSDETVRALAAMKLDELSKPEDSR